METKSLLNLYITNTYLSLKRNSPTYLRTYIFSKFINY